jgi:Legume lectin domain/Bacterial lectin
MMRNSRRRSVLAVFFALFAFAVANGRAFAQYINYSSGFSDASKLQLNGSAALVGDGIQLTDGKQFEAGSFFYKQRVSLFNFTTSFDFQLTDANADGFAFVVQTLGSDALGSSGGGLGYGNPPGGVGPAIGYQSKLYYDTSSLAVAFDLHRNLNEGPNSIRLEGAGVTNGANDSGIDLTPYGINLHSGHRFHAKLTSFTGYVNGIPTGGITVVLTDLQTGVTASVLPQYIDGSTNIASTGYAGFTGGTGAGTATQTIYNWTFGLPSETTPTPGTDDVNSIIIYPSGFPSLPDFVLNGSASVVNNALELTNDKQFEAASVFSAHQLFVGSYMTDFDFDLGDGNADGFTFVVNTGHHNALGSPGGGLGYGPDRPDGPGVSIPLSYALKFDLHNNDGEGANSTGVYYNGASPTVPAVDMTPSINLHSGHTYHARLLQGYVGEQFPSLVLTLVDLTEYKVFRYIFNLTGPGSTDQFASIGFTAGTGATPSTVRILNWTYAPL